MPKRRRSRRKKRQNYYWVLIGISVFFFGALFVVLAVQKNIISERQVAVEESRAAESSRERAKKQAFIDRLVPHAKVIQTTDKILPSITIAQAILESDWGKSTLSKDYMNLFGIKGSNPTNTKEMTTQEYVNDEWVTIKDRFRVYKNWEESMDDHAALFINGTDWNPKQYATVLSATDYKTAAKALQSSGYATDPDYASKLIDVVETYSLNEYD